MALGLFGCGHSPANMTKGAVITKIVTDSNNDGCLYYTRNYAWDGNLKLSEAYFLDRCGKFTVGDTVVVQKLTKTIKP